MYRCCQLHQSLETKKKLYVEARAQLRLALKNNPKKCTGLIKHMWVKEFAEFTLSGTVLEIQAFFCFAIFVKNLKIQYGRHFWWDKKFLKIESATQQSYPIDQNFCRNCSM